MKTCTIKRLLCWCICLFVNSQLSVVRGQLLFPPPPYALAETSGSQKGNNGQLTTDDGLPCQDSSPACLQTLGDLAVRNNQELAVLERAIQLQKKKLWTSWLNADGLNPLAIGLRLARNIAGGGDRAALKLEIARLELRRAELYTNLRPAVTQAVMDYETAVQQHSQLQTKLALHQARLNLIEATYRLGNGSTEAMWQLWLTREEMATQLAVAVARRNQTLRQLLTFFTPAQQSTIPHAWIPAPPFFRPAAQTIGKISNTTKSNAPNYCVSWLC